MPRFAPAIARGLNKKKSQRPAHTRVQKSVSTDDDISNISVEISETSSFQSDTSTDLGQHSLRLRMYIAEINNYNDTENIRYKDDESRFAQP